ncbi:MAG: hypothetical protein Ct9H300mP19_05950 [Dehalococcoidia bacterium]|nr:MAG: hypothetical protein Ct9H300mP19_05950 [Dehalococcoidia bacterium]
MISPEIRMLDQDGNPIKFPRPGGASLEGFDTNMVDGEGNVVGDPAGQTWATAMFDQIQMGPRPLGWRRWG